MNSVYDVWTSPYGFLHSEICGSMDICSSPQLIAAYRVLHRLPVPRHSPCALLSLTMRYITYPSSELVMRESLLLHSTNIVVYPNILLFMGLHYFISFAVFVVQFSRCVFTMTAVCRSRFLLDSFNLLDLVLRGRPCSVCRSFWLGVFYFTRRLVGTSGFEPPTSRLSGVRSNHLSYAPISSGGDEEDRTPDPLRARQVLSQLSYTPI